MTPRTGRPPIENPRTNIYRVRLSDVEQAALIEVATDAKIEPSAWIREVALAAIERAMKAKRKAVTQGPKPE